MQILIAAVLLAAAPKTSGVYFPAVAAAHVERGDFEPIDLATFVSFSRDTMTVAWPAEKKTAKWKAGKGGLEVNFKGEKGFVAAQWTAGSDGTVTSTLLYLGDEKPQETVLRWVPQTIEQLWAAWQKRMNERALKRFAGTWTNGEHTIELAPADELARIPSKLTWDGKPVAFLANECSEGCGKFGTLCLTPPSAKAETVPRLAYVNATLVQVTWQSACTTVPGEPWGFALEGGTTPLKRQ